MPIAAVAVAVAVAVGVALDVALNVTAAVDLSSGWSKAGGVCLMPIAVIAAINVIRCQLWQL